MIFALSTMDSVDTPMLPVLWRKKSCQQFVWYFYIQLNTLLLLKKENMDAPWCALRGRRQSIAGERELGMLLRTKVASSPSSPWSIFSDIFFIFVIWTIISTGDHWYVTPYPASAETLWSKILQKKTKTRKPQKIISGPHNSLNHSSIKEANQFVMCATSKTFEFIWLGSFL